MGRADVAAEFGRPCHRTWKTSITRQSLKRRLPYLPAVQKTRKRGSRREPTRDRGAERTSFEIPREGREFLRKNLRRFSARRGGRLFFLSSLSLSLPPCLSFSLSCCFFSTVSNPDVRRYKLMKCLERKRSAVPLKITSAACRNNRRDELLRLPYSSQTRFTLRLKCSTLRIRW